jgi:hypothetical protein
MAEQFATFASCPRAGAVAPGWRSVASNRARAITRSSAAALMWFKRFDTPILLPDGGRLLTLQDAADFIAALPKAERDAVEWRLAMEALVIAAERGGSVMLASVAILKALNRGEPPPPEPEPEPPPAPPKLRIVR